VSASKLIVLEQYSDALLLAEAGALLHDFGKLSSQFIDRQSLVPSVNSSNFKHENAVEMINGFVDPHFLIALRSGKLRDRMKLALIGKQEHIGQILDLILHHHSSRHHAFLVRLLNRCDGIDSGADKGTTRQTDLPNQAKQPFDNTSVATAFGYESKIDPKQLDDLRKKLSEKMRISLSNLIDGGKALSVRSDILREVERVYQIGLGETRRSANDVTLWDHSFSVASLFKSSIANLAITGILNENILNWRLLCINFDVLGLYAKAIKISDLLAYQQAVETAYEAVKRLVEEEYPLGNEVYRDTSGIYFTFPDLDLWDELGKLLRNKVENVEHELAPRIRVGQAQGSTATEQLKRILSEQRKAAIEVLATPFGPENLSSCWDQLWENVPKGKWEVCPVCRLRPKPETMEVCQHCGRRRQLRIQDWRNNPAKTIWLDEIADHHDRIALIVGKFGLDDWLSGDLVQTMLVRCEPDNTDSAKRFVSKNPSPARLRRVWETCQYFWSKTVEEKIFKEMYDAAPSQLLPVRLSIVPDETRCWRENVPYDGTINGQPISLLWDEGKKNFLTIINLQLAAIDANSVDEIMKKWPSHEMDVTNPDNPKEHIHFRIKEVKSAPDKFASYQPTLTLLSSPDRFLAFIPATDALKVADKIRQEYASQFGKVQDRLPLFLSLVFFKRKMPLTAVMDAARRMLAVQLSSEHLKVRKISKKGLLADGWPQKVEVGLDSDTHQINFDVKTVMGDDITPDFWYPYFFLEEFADGAPSSRARQFQYNGCGLVHVNDLHEGDRVLVTPSRFAYLFLESTAQRFRFGLKEDVMLLDELPHLSEMWLKLKQSGITDTGLRNVASLLERKGEEWGKASPEFIQLAHVTLKQAKLFKRKNKNGHELPDIISPDDIISGRFAHCLELHLRILKRRLKEE